MPPLRFSIVTPSYNQGKFLEQTICSVLDQGDPDLEYFIIDGGSNDESPGIIQKYADRLTGWVSEKDKGQADAINKGLVRCTGEIIAWLNSDDYYLPGAFLLVEQAFENHPEAGLVYGNVLSVDAGGKAINLQQFSDFKLNDLMCFKIISQPAVFMRRSVFEKAGLLNPDLHYLLDHQLWLRMAVFAPIVHIPMTLAAARYHADAKNVAQTAGFGMEAFQIIEWMKTQPEFAPIYTKEKNKILGGAHRLNAFYLLEGGQYRECLTAYRNSFWNEPSAAMKDWHRIIYAFLALLGMKSFRTGYMKLRKFFKRY